jgi:hypothetical protein
MCMWLHHCGWHSCGSVAAACWLHSNGRGDLQYVALTAIADVDRKQPVTCLMGSAHCVQHTIGLSRGLLNRASYAAKS